MFLEKINTSLALDYFSFLCFPTKHFLTHFIHIVYTFRINECLSHTVIVERDTYYVKNLLNFAFSPLFQFSKKTNPLDKHVQVLINKYGLSADPVAPQMFGFAGREHMEKYGMFKKYFKIHWQLYACEENQQVFIKELWRMPEYIDITWFFN